MTCLLILAILAYSLLSASSRTSGCGSGASQTSDGLLINPFDGQSRPDETSVQSSWVNQAPIPRFSVEEDKEFLDVAVCTY